MVESAAMNGVLARHSLDLLQEELGRWLRTNRAAQAAQRTLPPETLPNLDDWHVIVPAMAMLDPERLRTAEAIIRSAMLTVDGLAAGSLSHVAATVERTFGAEPSDEKTRNGAMVDEERLSWEYVEKLETRLDEAQALAREAVEAVKALEMRLAIAAAAVTAGVPTPGPQPGRRTAGSS